MVCSHPPTPQYKSKRPGERGLRWPRGGGRRGVCSVGRSILPTRSSSLKASFEARFRLEAYFRNRQHFRYPLFPGVPLCLTAMRNWVAELRDYCPAEPWETTVRRQTIPSISSVGAVPIPIPENGGRIAAQAPNIRCTAPTVPASERLPSRCRLSPSARSLLPLSLLHRRRQPHYHQHSPVSERKVGTILRAEHYRRRRYRQQMLSTRGGSADGSGSWPPRRVVGLSPPRNASEMGETRKLPRSGYGRYCEALAPDKQDGWAHSGGRLEAISLPVPKEKRLKHNLICTEVGRLPAFPAW